MRSRLTSRDVAIASRVKSNEALRRVGAEKGGEKECFPADAEKAEARSRERGENKRVGGFRFANVGGINDGSVLGNGVPPESAPR